MTARPRFPRHAGYALGFRSLGFFVLLLLGSLAPAAAAPISRDEAAAIEAVVRAQLDAFARDDAPGAFALATGAIRERFGTAERFLEAVRTDYAAVYRPRTVQFDEPVVIEGAIFQPVRLTDARGEAWIALYAMQREREGRWRINGCELGRVSGRPV